MFKRLRVSFARLLLRGTDCTIQREKIVHGMRTAATDLKAYVDHSGGLTDPSRINAWRRVYGLASTIEAHALSIEVGS